MRAERPAGWPYALLFAATVAVMTAVTTGVWLDKSEARRVAQRAEDLRCLAENVFYESRGEPLVGQYAVAEVTMNRVASPDFPATVCGVVRQRGAFSWTYSDDLVEPYGYEWRRAKAVADSVYDNVEAPIVNGALFYHATHMTPDWASSRSQVARVGHHLFYL